MSPVCDWYTLDLGDWEGFGEDKAPPLPLHPSRGPPGARSPPTPPPPDHASRPGRLHPFDTQTMSSTTYKPVAAAPAPRPTPPAPRPAIQLGPTPTPVTVGPGHTLSRPPLSDL